MFLYRATSRKTITEEEEGGGGGGGGGLIPVWPN